MSDKSKAATRAKAAASRATTAKKKATAKKATPKKSTAQKTTAKKTTPKKPASTKSQPPKKPAARRAGKAKPKARGSAAGAGWRARFESMVAELRKNPRVKVEEVRFGKPATNREIALARASNGGELPAGMEALYREMGSFDLLWWANVPGGEERDPAASGRIHLPRLPDVFRSGEGWLYFPAIHGANHPFAEIRPVDLFIEEACAVLYPVTGKPEPDQQVCYHYCGEELHTTGLLYEQWLERLLVSRGFWYWIQSCAAGKQRSSSTENFRDVVPKVFPGIDLSLFRPGHGSREIKC